MKKAASILALTAFTVAMFVTQTDKINFDFGIETILACDDCSGDEDPRGGNA
jgi:hypothetical protein